jgi:hypothetical protein
VDDAFWDPLAVEPGQFLCEVLVLEQDRPGRPGGLRVLVVSDGRA